MFGDQIGGVGVIFKHAGEAEVGAAETEIYGGLFGATDEFREIVSGAEPGEDAITLPTPGNHLLTREVCGKVPLVFESVTFNAAVQAVIVPTERHQYPLLIFSHVGLTIGGCFSNSTPRSRHISAPTLSGRLVLRA